MQGIICGMISALLAGFDLYVKKFVEKEVARGEEQEECGGRVVIRHVHNQGFALDMVDKYPKVVKWVSLGALSSIAAYALLIWKQSASIVEKLAAALVVAGGISNTYERFKKGYVVDYIAFKTKWKKFNRVTFNLGDFYIFLGGFVWIIKTIIKESCR